MRRVGNVCADRERAAAHLLDLALCAVQPLLAASDDPHTPPELAEAHRYGAPTPALAPVTTTVLEECEIFDRATTLSQRARSACHFNGRLRIAAFGKHLEDSATLAQQRNALTAPVICLPSLNCYARTKFHADLQSDSAASSRGGDRAHARRNAAVAGDGAFLFERRPKAISMPC